jgi:hypothetical protein
VTIDCVCGAGCMGRLASGFALHRSGTTHAMPELEATDGYGNLVRVTLGVKELTQLQEWTMVELARLARTPAANGKDIF